MVASCKICLQLHTNMSAPGIYADVCANRFCLDIVIENTLLTKYGRVGICMICDKSCNNQFICLSDDCSRAILIKFGIERTKYRYLATIATMNIFECCKCHKSFQCLQNLPICIDCEDSNISRDKKKRRYDIKGLSSTRLTCIECCCVFNPRYVIPLLFQESYILDNYNNYPKCFNCCCSQSEIEPIVEFWNTENAQQYSEMYDYEAEGRILQRLQKK